MATPIALPDPPSVAVVGLGYVGLPLAAAFSAHGPVIGFDVDESRITELRAGHDRTGEVDLGTCVTTRVRLTADPVHLAEADVIVVAVPTPIDARNLPDLGPLERACALIGTAIAAMPEARTPIVVVESTVYPGVTEDVCAPLIARASGRERGAGFFMGYSPERINPGDREHGLARIVKVVAGETDEVTQALAGLYGRITNEGIFTARDIRTAEAAKVIENAQRDINIAFVNEVAMIVERMGLSVYDVLDAAATKWNFLGFRPGLVGGHCIGVDPYYLAHSAKQVGHRPEAILAGRRINDAMGHYVAARIAEALRDGEAEADPGHGIRPARILVLGLTFKENVPDLRNTRVIDVIRGLEAHGHALEVHDPLADPDEAEQIYGLTLLDELNGARYDCVVGAVAHNAFRALDAPALAALLEPGGLLADIKGTWRELELPTGIRRWQL